jgi:hypothetical protein
VIIADDLSWGHHQSVQPGGGLRAGRAGRVDILLASNNSPEGRSPPFPPNLRNLVMAVEQGESLPSELNHPVPVTALKKRLP